MPGKASGVEKLYQSIKAEICSGRLLPGQRVDLLAYSNRFGASKGPVRNIFNRLVGEGLLETHPNEGFFRPMVTEQVVIGEYDLGLVLVFDALDHLAAESRSPTDMPPIEVTTDDPLIGIEQFFTGIVALRHNAAATRTIKGVNDHLHALRRRKGLILFDLKRDLEALTIAWESGNLKNVRKAIQAYHTRRLRAVSRIVALAYISEDEIESKVAQL